MTDQRGQEENHQVKRKENRLRHRRDVQDEREHDRGHWQCPDHPQMRENRPPREGQYKREQVKCQGNDPEQRKARDIRGQVHRHAEHQACRDESQDDPAQDLADPKAVQLLGRA